MLLRFAFSLLGLCVRAGSEESLSCVSHSIWSQQMAQPQLFGTSPTGAVGKPPGSVFVSVDNKSIDQTV